ncbi:hypothetical protein SS322685_0979 [Shigella sonnei 3226-85]|nr:hypothetical protein SS322685_0979 [Shigella sonnei 3226-85]
MRKFWNVSFLMMVTEAIWLLFQCGKLWQSWLMAKNFDD